MSWILSYGCTSAAGPETANFWNSLEMGIDHSQLLITEKWPVPAPFQLRACRWPASQYYSSGREALVTELLSAWCQTLFALDPESKLRIKKGKLGVIFASTKGNVDDYIWNNSEAELYLDPLSSILEDFLELAGLEAHQKLCVSNACASSLSALLLANEWLKSGKVSDVLVLAADRVGPFVMSGFQSLHAVTPGRAMPFDRARSGLQLGEAAVALLLTGQDPKLDFLNSVFKLKGVGLQAEGFAATRPLQSGEGLKNACLQIDNLQNSPPDLIIAHGTATQLNDSAEDRAFVDLFFGCAETPWITASKGCIGHTLGASGAMDVVAACEVLKRQKVFSITNTTEIDPDFKGRYLLSNGNSTVPMKLDSVLVTSIGFGGINAGALIQRPVSLL